MVFLIQLSIIFLILISIESYSQEFYGISYYCNHPPLIDGFISPEEWKNASKLQLEDGFVTDTESIYGFLLAQNDASNLYILLDLVEDTSDELSLQEDSWPDYFWLSFDVDLDSKISPNIDVLFSAFPSNRSLLGKAFHIEPFATTGMTNTASVLGLGFGPSLNSEVHHRFWEIAINLKEINAEPHGNVSIGYRIHSDIPSFTVEYPLNYAGDFSNLMEINLGVKYQPEQPNEPPEQPDEPAENLNLGPNEIILLITFLVLTSLVFITLLARKRNKELQSKFKH